jgi:hypothetical protein
MMAQYAAPGAVIGQTCSARRRLEYFGVPEIDVLFEASSTAGLGEAGMPEEQQLERARKAPLVSALMPTALDPGEETDSPVERDGFEPSAPRARNGSFWWKREDF